MLFVDGENLTIEGRKLADTRGIKINEGPSYLPNVYLWMPNVSPAANLYENAYLKLQPTGIRSYYYCSTTGNSEQVTQARTKLRDLGFHSEVFRKEKGRRSNGVDITLAKDLLSHAFFGNYDVAVLLAGDGDYVPLVNEVKRLGKVVYSVFFKSSTELRLASDHTLYLDDFFIKSWANGADKTFVSSTAAEK